MFMFFLHVLFVAAIICPSLDAPTNGHFKNTCTNTYGSTCQIECASGYELIGNSDLRCNEAGPSPCVGAWNSHLPTCKG